MPEPTDDSGFAGKWWDYPPLRSALLAMGIALLGFALHRLGVVGAAWERVFYWIALPIGGFHWAREGLEEFVEEREVGIEFLMLAATAGCGVLGMWNEAAALVVLYGAAEGIEELAFARTRHAMRGLLDRTPKQATVLRDGAEVRIPAADLVPGDRFLVRPGGSVATDGTVVEGQTSLDESAITGEPVPVDKQQGDRVFAASMNGPGAITVLATAAVADNSLSKIIRLVEEAQDHKGRAQAWMERFGKRYSPVVLLSAVLLLLVPWALGAEAAVWLQRAVVLLVAAAPCALVISLPIAMAAGIGGAGRSGILIKGGAHLEHLGVIRTIAFDKTGTLTHGRPRLTKVVSLGAEEQELLSIAASLERDSEHPLARAVTEAAREGGIPLRETKGFRALPGSGLRAEIEGTTWFLANPRFFDGRGLDSSPLAAAIEGLEGEGQTVVLIGTEARVMGCLAFQDTLRSNAASMVEAVHQLGVRTVVLTGDNGRAARQVARSLGIDDVRAGLHPEEKVTAIQELSKAGPVLMVGDGINDAPALASATCGVAMGAAGTDAAIEAADIALLADDLDKLTEALRFGRKARKVSRQNIALALLALGILVPLAVGGVISVTLAVIVHEGSELLAVANGLRAGRPA